MTSFPKLTKPPIVEALIDLRVSQARDVSAESLQVAAKQVSDAYPLSEALYSSEAEQPMLTTGYSVPPPPTRSIHGFLSKNDAENEVVQFRRDGFTFNRLTPYSSWDDLLPRAMRAWSVFVRVAGIDVVDRASVRYVNQLRLGHEKVDLKTFLRMRPTGWPEDAGRQVGFLHRVIAKGPEPDTLVNVVESVDPAIPPRPLQLLLDIEALYQPVAGLPLSRIESVLATLRDLKNRVFFGVLTPEMVETLR